MANGAGVGDRAVAIVRTVADGFLAQAESLA